MTGVLYLQMEDGQDEERIKYMSVSVANEVGINKWTDQKV